MRKTFIFRGCMVQPETLPESKLVGCNNNVNRYLRHIWRVLFPDATWTWVGTKDMARACVNRVGHSHGVV